MTREKMLAHIAKLPDNLFKEYGFKKLDDISDERYELVNGYKYYPNLHSILIGSRFVTWEAKGNDDTIEVDPYNPEHFAELKRRGMRFQGNDTIGVITFTTDGRMECDFGWRDSWPSDRIKESSKFVSFPFDDTDIFYNPKNENIICNPDFRLLAECLFLGKRYNGEYVVPYKNMPIDYWG